MIQYYIEIVGGLDNDLELYNKIEPYKGNLINLGNGKVWVHGKTTPAVFQQVLRICLEVSNLKVEITHI